MLMSLSFDLHQAVYTISTADRRMADVMAHIGPCRLELTPIENPFEALLRAIIYQQLSTRAADTIYNRVLALFPAGKPDPSGVLDLPGADLRSAGMSRAKINYAKDLALKTLEGKMPDLETLHSMEDRAIVERLCEVKGIGRWTVEMLLIFSMGRPDVLPATDLGVRKGFREVYGHEELPTVPELDAFGERWRPFRSVASWYLWRVVDSGFEL
jgi:DNA-3-methyladenine glycosylase II